jgi:UDP-glucose 4-epimerase
MLGCRHAARQRHPHAAAGATRRAQRGCVRTRRRPALTSCLIIGGGFLGGHLAEHLSDAGNDVVVYSRSFSPSLLARERATPTLRLVEGVVPPGDGLGELLSAADVVFYMAGTSTPAMAQDDPGGSIRRYVVPAAAVLDLMHYTDTRRIVIASSGGTVYGTVSELPTPEDHSTEPSSLHGHNALTVERYARFFSEQHGFEPVILRFSNPYGPGQIARRGQGVIAAWADALARDQEIIVYGGPGVRRDFVFVEDAARAAAVAGLSAPPGTYNVGSGCATTLADVLDMLQRAAGRQARLHTVAARAVDVPVTQLDSTRLRLATGWVPQTSLAAGIQATWDWVRMSSLAGERSS